MHFVPKKKKKPRDVCVCSVHSSSSLGVWCGDCGVQIAAAVDGGRSDVSLQTCMVYSDSKLCEDGGYSTRTVPLSREVTFELTR